MAQQSLFEAIFAYVGGTLSIVLAVLQVVIHFRDKPRLVLTAHPNYRRLEPDEAPAIGLEMDIPDRGGRVEVVFEVRIANAGRVAMEVRGLAIISADEPTAWVVTDDSLPQSVLPFTSTVVRLQPGFLQHYNTGGIAALDALGQMHFLPTAAFVDLVKQAQNMPLEVRTVRDRFDSQEKKGFVARMEVTKLNLDLERAPRVWRRYYKKRKGSEE